MTYYKENNKTRINEFYVLWVNYLVITKLKKLKLQQINRPQNSKKKSENDKSKFIHYLHYHRIWKTYDL